MKAIADLDGNGLPDPIVCGRAGPLVWYQSPGWDKFTISTDIGVAGSTTGITSGDIDNDGDMDVVLANGYWYENPSPDSAPNSSWTRHELGAISRAHDILLEDLDGDGDLDAVKRDQGERGDVIWVYRQDTPTSWTGRQLPAFTGEGLTLGDLDADGDKDILISGYWYENTRDPINGPWTRRGFTNTFNYPHVLVATGNINNDAWLDVVLVPSESAEEQYHISWFEGVAEPAGSNLVEHILQDPQQAVVHSVQLADVNNDHHCDIIFAEMQQGDNPDKVAILINQQSGSSWVEQIESDTGSHGIQATDVDRDGDIDFFGANWRTADAPDGARVNLWRNDINPKLVLDQWQRHVIDAERPWTAVFIRSGDIDRDGLPDIITGGWWYENPGLPSGAWQRHDIGGSLYNMAAVYDYDRDGDLDVLGTGGEGSASNDTFYWARNNGFGTFTIMDNITSGDGDFLQGAAVAAFAPGRLSIALSWHQAGHGIQTLTVPSNASTGIWTWERISDISLDEDLSVGDVDRDGDMDLLLGTRILLNNGVGVWEMLTIDETNTHPPDRNELADMDGDGDLDAVVSFEGANAGRDLVWYRQPVLSQIDQAWPKQVIGTMTGPMSVDVGDIDRDGDMDVVAGEHNYADSSTAQLLVFENLDKGLRWERHLIYTGDEHHDGAQLVDIDNDGDLDVISIGWRHSNVVLYENLANTPDTPDTPVVEPALAMPIITPDGGTFTDGVSVQIDATTAQTNIYYTLDGSEPTTSDQLYTSPIWIDHSLTLNARAFRQGYVSSAAANAAFVIIQDETPPQIVSFSFQTDANTIVVTFSEAVDKSSATDPGNYTISSNVDVLAATLSPSGDQVILATTMLTSGAIYQLAVNNVVDLSGNSIPPDTQVNFVYQDFDESAGLVGYWPLDERSGTTANDCSGNGLHGIIHGGEWAVEDGIQLNGSDAYIALPNIDLSGQAMSISLWFNSDDLNNCSARYRDCRLIAKASGTEKDDHYWMMSTYAVGSSTRLRFRLKTNGDTDTLVASSGDIQNDSWVHAVAVYDGSQMRLYQDNQPVGSLAKSGTLDTNASVGVNIGRSPDGYGEWAGMIDDVQIYNYALTAEDIDALFNAHGNDNSPPAAPNAVAVADVQSGFAPLTVQFDGTGSSDSDGTITDYIWDFGPSTGSGQIATYTYTEPGTYTVDLTITDSDGLTDTDSVQIVVSEPSPAELPTSPETPVDTNNESAGSGGGGGCFIRSIFSE